MFFSRGLIARSLFGMALSLASTLGKVRRRNQTPMPIPWGDPLDLARCVALIGKNDLEEATTAMGRCMFTLQRELLLEPGRTDLRAHSVRQGARTRETGRYANSLEHR